jgi:hypothetical protein
MTIQDLAASSLAGQPAPWHSFRDGVQPFPLNGTSKIDNEARELYQIVEQRQQHVIAVNRAERDAQLAGRRAEETYQAEIARSAEAGVVSTLDGELLAACESAAAAANPQLHRRRRQQASVLAQEAEAAYIEFIDTHAIEFVRETQEDAHGIAKRSLEAREEAAQILQSAKQEHWALVEATRFIVGGTHPLTRDDIEQEFGKPPTLTPDALARFDPRPLLATEPEAEPVEPTSD